MKKLQFNFVERYFFSLKNNCFRNICLSKKFIALKSCAERNGAQAPRQWFSERFSSFVYRLKKNKINND